MKITAIGSIIEWDAERRQMAVLNPEDTAEVGDTLAQSLIDAGRAEAATEEKPKKAAKAEAPADGPPVLKGKNKATLLAIAAAEGVEIAEGASNKEIAVAIEAKRAALRELKPVEGIAAAVLVSVEGDGGFKVHAPWLAEPEPFETAEAAEARQTELRSEGPPEGWVDSSEQAPE